MIRRIKKAICLMTVSAMMVSNLACMGLKGINIDTETTVSTTENASTTTQQATTEEITTQAVKTDFTDADLAEQKKFEDYCDKLFKEEVTGDFLSYHFTIKDGSVFGIDEPKATLGSVDLSDAAIEKEKNDDLALINELKAIDYNALTEDMQFDYDVILERMESEFKSYDNVYLYEPFSPMNGFHANVSEYFTDYRFDNKEDIDKYIAVMKCLPEYFDGLLEYEKVKSEKGLFMSDASCDSVIEQCEDYLQNKDNHFMITVFNNNIDALEFLTDEEKAEYKKQNEDAVKNYLLVSFENTLSTFKSLKGTGKNNSQGECGYEGGKEYYEYLFEHRTGSSKTPDEAMKYLEAEKKKLTSEVYSTYIKNPDAYEYFTENTDDLFSATDSMTPTEMINKLMETATEDYPAFEKIPFRAEYLDKSLENIQEGVLAYYLSPALDDKDNNLIRVNGLHTTGLWTTLAHEGYPGHMFQNTYYVSTNPRNIRTILNFVGYGEGWAMYTSYGVVDNYEFEKKEYADTLAKLYRINEEYSYLVMGIVDIGVNYEGWTLSELTSYLSSNGLNSGAAKELFDTVAGDPALYQSYVMGYYEMKDLREYAENQLGDKFDVVGYNKVILEAGPCQYDLLKRKVDKFILESR